MGASVFARIAGVLSVGAFLVGFTGFTDFTHSRHRATPSKTTAHTITGYDDQYTSYQICAYQQTRNPQFSTVLGCAWPTTTGSVTDACGKVWYRFTLNVTLLGDIDYWSKDNANIESTRVFLTRNQTNGGLYTGTVDESSGPSDASTCYESRVRSNMNVAPVVYYLGSVPNDLWLGSGVPPSPGVPFKCGVAEGCDAAYGKTLMTFYNTAFRTNPSLQDTSKTLFDMWSASTGWPAPVHPWGYRLESGNCTGGSTPGAGCDNNAQCAGGGTCTGQQYTIMRRMVDTAENQDSLQIRRGENRRNSLVEAWVKLKKVDVNNREIGIISRWYDRNNYFGFTVAEYPFDVVRIHTYINGTWTAVGYQWPSMNLTVWNRIGFKITDNGSYANGLFTPNGNCAATGYLNQVSVISYASTPCSHAPYGNYGIFSYIEQASSQAWALYAFPCMTGGVCPY